MSFSSVKTSPSSSEEESKVFWTGQKGSNQTFIIILKFYEE